MGNSLNISLAHVPENIMNTNRCGRALVLALVQRLVPGDDQFNWEAHCANSEITEEQKATIKSYTMSQEFKNVTNKKNVLVSLMENKFGEAFASLVFGR